MGRSKVKDNSDPQVIGSKIFELRRIGVSILAAADAAVEDSKPMEVERDQNVSLHNNGRLWPEGGEVV
jgi:hypothetical protein